MRTSLMVLSVVMGMVGLGGCAAPEEGDTAASTSDALDATPIGTLRTILSVRVAGGAVRTSVLVTNDIVVTSARWVPATTDPSAITIRMPNPNGNDFVTTGTYVNVNEDLGLVAIRLATPVVLPAGTVGFTGFLGSTPPVGLKTTCYGYATGDDRVQSWTWRVVGAPVPNGVVMEPSPDVAIGGGGPGVVRDGDAGMPCIDGRTGLVVGLVRRAPKFVSTTTTFDIVSGAAVKDWIGAMKNLGVVRNAALAQGFGPVTFYQPRWGHEWCMNVTGTTAAPMNQWTCDGGSAQRFWLYPTGAGQLALVSDKSGLCVDVVGAGTAVETPIQQYPCHYGTNQSFDPIAVSGGYFLDPAHIPHSLPGPSTGNGAGMGIAVAQTAANQGMGDGVPLVLRGWSFSAAALTGSNLKWLVR